MTKEILWDVQVRYLGIGKRNIHKNEKEMFRIWQKKYLEVKIRIIRHLQYFFYRLEKIYLNFGKIISRN